MLQKAHHLDDYQPVPPLLRELRSEAGHTQRALAELVGRPQSWVHNCERGERRADLAEFVAWARACGCAPRTALDRYVKALDS